MNALASVKNDGYGWTVTMRPTCGKLWIEMGGFPTMKQAVFVGNSIMRKLGWKLTEPWIKN